MVRTDEMVFDGRVAIVTGAGRGLGREHAKLLAHRGATVIVNDIGAGVDGTGEDTRVADSVVSEIRESGGDAMADHSDVSTAAAGRAIVESAMQKFGRVDIVVNNAGILRDRTVQNVTEFDLEAVLSVHLKGAFNVTIPAFAVMREQGYGRIVSTSSGAGLFGNFGQTVYGAAKMGLVGLTRVLAVEGARRGVRANAIAPIAMTRMTENLMGSEGSTFVPSLVSPVVAYLCSEACELSGEVLSVGGGRVARVFIGETPGIHVADLTVEDVRDRLAEICDTDGFAVPTDMAAEMDLYRRVSESVAVVHEAG